MHWHMVPGFDEKSSNETAHDDQNMKDAGSKSTNMVTMYIHYIHQCSMGMDPDIPIELRSKWYKKLDIEFKNTTG
jgi:hypothetical protein